MTPARLSACVCCSELFICAVPIRAADGTFLVHALSLDPACKYFWIRSECKSSMSQDMEATPGALSDRPVLLVSRFILLCTAGGFESSMHENIHIACDLDCCWCERVRCWIQGAEQNWEDSHHDGGSGSGDNEPGPAAGRLVCLCVIPTVAERGTGRGRTLAARVFHQLPSQPGMF